MSKSSWFWDNEHDEGNGAGLPLGSWVQPLVSISRRIRASSQQKTHTEDISMWEPLLEAPRECGEGIPHHPRPRANRTQSLPLSGENSLSP